MDVTPVTLSGSHALALYDLTAVDDEFQVQHSYSSHPFDYAAYSEFKYGQRNAAEKFATQLALLLLAHFGGRITYDQQVVVIGTPYKRLPNAARMLAISVERQLRLASVPSSYSYIYQHRLAEGDYGMLSQQDRDKRNQQKHRYLDPEDFAGKHVVVIDDVRITGSIERSIMQQLQGINVLSTTIVNLVRLDPAVALARPHLEDRLNHFAVKDLRDLKRLMNRRDEFVLTTRAVKFILQSPLRDIIELLASLDPTQRIELYEAIVDEGYDQMLRYHEGFLVVADSCKLTHVDPR